MLTSFKTFNHRLKSKRFSICPSFIDTLAVAENAGELSHFSDPATINFLLAFNIDTHDCLPKKSTAKETLIESVIAGAEGPWRSICF
jgi:hypothetical protein